MPDTVLTRPDGGGTLVRTAEDAALLGSQVVDTAERDAGLRDERRRKMFDTADHAATTFVEGVVDALSLGLIRETGDTAELRRDVNRGWSTAGMAVGTLGSLLTGVGPVAKLTRASEAVGKAAAKTFLRAGDTALATAAVTEATSGAALAGATAFGHAMMDTLIEDKSFASEAILDDMKLGGVLGGVAGGVMGAFGKLGKRSDVLAQGGALDASRAAGAINDSIKAYDDALEHYQKQYGALQGLRELDRLGPVSDGFLATRKAALSKAERLREHLRAFDAEAALSGLDDEAHAAFRGAFKNYRRAMAEVDDAMKAGVGEAAEASARATATRVDLNPFGKVVGELDDLRLRMHDMEQAALADTVVEGVQTPSNTADTLNLRSGLDVALEATPVGAEESAARTMGLLNEVTQVDPIPLGMVEGKKARMGGQLQEAAPLRQVAAARKLPAPPPESTVVDALPAGAAAGAIERDLVSAPTQIAPARTVVDARPAGGFADGFQLEDWYKAGQPGRVRPFHEAEQRALTAMEKLRTEAGGRLESAGALGILKKTADVDDNLGAYIDQVVSMRKAARMAADEARGVATPLRDAAANIVAGMVVDRMLGSKVAGFAAGFAGLGGRFASASGRLARRASEAVAKFMSPTKIRTGVVAATNQAHAYSDRGPIADPVERIQEIQFLAANPEGVRERVRHAAGDLAKVSPEMVRALEDRAVAQVTNLAIRAPAVYFDKLGRPLSPPGGKLREFYEYENAMNNLDIILEGIAKGSLTKPQAQALQDGYPSLHVKAASMFFTDPEQIQKLNRAKLRVVEMVTGAPLTGASDPMFLVRQAQAWQPPAPPAPPGKPQAFNINPTGAPTPAQANATGRAPGN